MVLDLVSLLLVAGSAVSIVILGLVIYYSTPSPKRPVVAESPSIVSVAAPAMPHVSSGAKPAEEKTNAPPPQLLVASVMVEPLVEVSEAPPPFSEDPIVPKRRKTARTGLPTDTTALNSLSSDAAASRVLVISAPKKKVRAYRNANSPVGSTSRKRRASPRNISVTPVSEIPVEPKNNPTEPSAVPNSASS